MDFKVKKIRNKIPEKETRDPLRPKLSKKPLIIFGIIIVVLLSGIVKSMKSIDYTAFLSVVGEDILTDNKGHTNFLLLGVGGALHEGSDLTDTIIVASLDHKKKLVTMLSVPRDFWSEDKKMGGSRINEIYFNRKKFYGDSSNEALEYTKNRIEDTLGISIQYWAKIDFEGFKDIIDAIGGIDINVEESIYDPLYPKEGTNLYETFSIQKGINHLDGNTALKYARSRHTTSDFDRAKRQQDILYAIKERMLKADILLSKNKIENILNSIKDNIETNIRIEEILSLGKYAKDISKDKIVQRLIHDDPSRCGGFLYTPERKFFNGAFVLVPAGGVEILFEYTNLIFNYSEIAQDNSKIHVLNSTNREGAAGETKQILQRYCFNINRYGNGRNKETLETTYYYTPDVDENGNTINSKPLALEFLKKLIPGKESTDIPEEYKEYMAGTDIILELGQDYTKSENYMADPFYSLPMPAETYDEDETGTETEDTPTEDTTTTEIPADIPAEEPTI